MGRSRVLDQAEARLGTVEPRVEREVVARWRAVCPEVVAGPDRIEELPGWVWSLNRNTANRVLAGWAGRPRAATSWRW